MNNSFLIIAAGLLAGMIHVLSGPDHAAAIAPLAANQPEKSWKTGLWWGLGHTLSVWTLAILVFFLRAFIPLGGLSRWGERLVGVVLIALGVWGLQRAFRSSAHYHVHEHDGVKHAHFHVHNASHSHSHHSFAPHRHKHIPLGIGVIHGFGGGAHLVAILPILALPGEFSAGNYIIGFGVGTILAMMCFSWLIGLCHKKLVNRFSKGQLWMQLSLSVLAFTAGVYWLINNF